MKFDNYVYLEPKKHQYFDKDGREYMSISKFRELFKDKFDPKIAFSVAGKGDYIGMTPEEVQSQWESYKNERSDDGTRIHDALELYEKTATIKPENEDLRAALISITSEYKHYHKIYQEQCLYSTEYLIAGTADKILQCTQSANSVIDLSDYKTNIKGIHQKQYKKDGSPVNKYFKKPIEHLMYSTYNDDALQLSIYALLLQMKYNVKIGALYIHFIPPNNPLAHKKIPVPYMKLEALAMLEYKKNLAIPITNQIINPY